MIAIIGVLGGILLPVFGTVRTRADQASCISNLRQIVAATNLAAQDNGGKYPNMHGYAWETTQGDPAPPGVWVADALAPYVGGTVNKDPTKLLRCPAAQKNPQEAWLTSSLYCHYRYNYYHGQNTKPLAGYMNAMLFFDTTYADWTQAQYAHYPGSGALMNVAYADGHVAPLSYAGYQRSVSVAGESDSDLFKLGWLK